MYKHILKKFFELIQLLSKQDKHDELLRIQLQYKNEQIENLTVEKVNTFLVEMTYEFLAGIHLW